MPAAKTRTISSAVDKLDKLPWADVKKEMVEEKGLDSSKADKIGEYVKLKGGEELLEQLMKDETLLKNKVAKEGMQDMKLLFQYLKAYGILERVGSCFTLAPVCNRPKHWQSRRCRSIFHWHVASTTTLVSSTKQ